MSGATGIEEVKGMLKAIQDETIASIKAASEGSQKAVSDLDARIKSIEADYQAKIKELDARVAARAIPGLAEETQKRGFSFHAALMGINFNDWSEGAFEKEVMAETAKKRSQNATDGSSGGYLVPEEVSSAIIDLAIADMPMMQMGVEKLTGLVGDLAIPKMTSRHTAYWLGENTAITESNGAVGQVNLKSKRLGSFTKLSDRLLRQTAGVAEGIVRQSLADSINLALDIAMIQGTGGENQPKGVVNYAGLTTTAAIGANGGAFTVSKAADMLSALDVANHLKATNKVGFIFRPEIKKQLKTQRTPNYSGDTAGTFIFSPPIISDEMLREMLGYSFGTSTQISKVLTKGSATDCSYVIAGAFNKALLGIWSDMVLATSNQAGYGTNSAFLQGEIWVKGELSCDFVLKDETAFTVISDASVSA